MGNIDIKSDWNTIDDVGETVPVSDGLQTSAPVQKAMENKESAAAKPHPVGMHLSAFTGIAIVVIAATMYVGVDSLRGSLTDTGGTGTTTITMTADNRFSPSAVSVTAGTTLILENKNANPQVLKAKAAPELFPTQVLFEKPVTFVIPAGTQGTFTYVSETMPKEELLTITVRPAMEAAALQNAEGTADLPPLPFGGPLSEIVSSQATSARSGGESLVTVVPATGGSSESAEAVPVISVGGSVSHSTAPAVLEKSSDIPENPYTVANAKRSPNIATTAEKLHSGAPLLDYPEYRPRTNANTGSEVWFVLIAAFGALTVAYRMRVFA